MSKKKICVTGYEKSLVASEGSQKNKTPDADPNIGNLPRNVDDDGNRDFDSAIGGGSVQSVSVEWKLQDLQDEFWTKKQRFLKNVAKAVDLIQEFLGSADGPINTILLSEVFATAGVDSTGLVAKLHDAERGITELGSVRALPVHRHKKL